MRGAQVTDFNSTRTEGRGDIPASCILLSGTWVSVFVQHLERLVIVTQTWNYKERLNSKSKFWSEDAATCFSLPSWSESQHKCKLAKSLCRSYVVVSWLLYHDFTQGLPWKPVFGGVRRTTNQTFYQAQSRFSGFALRPPAFHNTVTYYVYAIGSRFQKRLWKPFFYCKTACER